MRCSFCKRELPPVGALLFVKRTGDTMHFCSSKCEKSFMMGRNPRKKKWVRKPTKGEKLSRKEEAAKKEKVSGSGKTKKK